MKHFGRTINLKDDPEAIRQYIFHHNHSWSEVEGRLEALGVKKVRIFLHGRRLFMYMETRDDFDDDRFLHGWMTEPKCVEWEALMQRFQEPLPGAPPGVWWITMDSIYSFDAQCGTGMLEGLDLSHPL